MDPYHTIPGKLTCCWEPSVSAVVDTWQSYFVTLDAFKETVMVKGVSEARARGGKAWIVDSSTAKGNFPPEIQSFIGTDVFKKFAEIGIKYFITISSQSAATNMTIKNYSAKVGPAGIELVEATSAKDAIEWLKQKGVE